MDNNNTPETLTPQVTPEMVAELHKKGFWARIPNKKQFLGGAALYLVGLVLALVCSSTQLLAKDSVATVQNVRLSSGGENIYVIDYIFQTDSGREYARSYNYWTVTPDKDLRMVGEQFEVKYMPFLPSTDGTESFYPITMFVGILLFFGGWTMTKGRAPIVQTRKLKKDKSEDERRSKFYYPPDDTPGGDSVNGPSDDQNN